MTIKTKRHNLPTIAELEAIEAEGIAPITNADIELILENAPLDIDLDSFNPFDDGFDF